MKKFLPTVIIVNVLLVVTINNLVYAAASLSAVEDSSMLPYPDGKVEDTQRYFRIDAGASISIHEQVREQFSEFLQEYQAYFETQRDFLKWVLQEREETKRPFKEIDSIFSGVSLSDEKILEKLQIITSGKENWIRRYIKPLISWWQDVCAKPIGDLFIDIVKKRDERLIIRFNSYKEATIPSTIPVKYQAYNEYDQIEARLVTSNLRMFDELLYVLFPYITVNDLRAANTKEHLIQRDIGLMKFLGGFRSVPLDPDSTINQYKRGIVGGVIWIDIPISEESKAVYRHLRERLAEFKQATTNISVSTSEDSVSKKKAKNRKQKGRKMGFSPLKKSHGGDGESEEGEAEFKSDAMAAVDDPGAASVDVVDASSSSIAMEAFAAASSVPCAAVKTSAAPYAKPVVPMGGWSSKDKERATGAASRLSNFKASPLAGAGGDEGANCKFTPQSPINLSHANYDTLQALLDPATPEFTITFDQVVHLLDEDLGITVTRNCGSHAHMNTPGRNKKTLVDLHGGWTDKFNKTTMKELGELMINLGLDKTENVIVGKV